MWETILFEKKGTIATITLNRPERLNATNVNVSTEVIRALEECEADDEVRVVVLTGSGRAFCAGDDLSGIVPEKTLERPPKDETELQLFVVPRMVKAIRKLMKPVIARINGLAYGGGFDLCLACDFRIASETATFALPFVLRGISAGATMLPKYVGLGKATEMLLTGRSFRADEAERLGLMTKVVPPDELDAEVNQLAQQLAKAATRALGLTKRALNQAMAAGIDQAYLFEAHSSRESWLTEDIREGVKAFSEKREPQYKGK